MSVEEKPSDASLEREEKQQELTDTKKKASSYYYWHGHEKERAKVGDVAPMPKPVLVKKDESDAAPATILPHPITKYSWSDSGKSVTVYVDTKFNNQESMLDGSLCVEFKKKHLILSYKAVIESTKALRGKQLMLPLSKSIKPAESSYKVKETDAQIVVRLVKKESGIWLDLVSKDNKNKADDDDSDDDKEEDLVDEDN